VEGVRERAFVLGPSLPGGERTSWRSVGGAGYSFLLVFSLLDFNVIPFLPQPAEEMGRELDRDAN
jgi:hypothetical protein